MEGYQKYIIDDQEIERVIRSYPFLWKRPEARPQVCFIGCPHLSLKQLRDWAEKIASGLEKAGRRRVAVPTSYCAPRLMWWRPLKRIPPPTNNCWRPGRESPRSVR